MNQYNGMTVQAATEAAKMSGFEVRVVTTGPQVLSNDFRPGRITLQVVNGIVVAAQVG